MKQEYVHTMDLNTMNSSPELKNVFRKIVEECTNGISSGSLDAYIYTNGFPHWSMESDRTILNIQTGKEYKLPYRRPSEIISSFSKASQKAFALSTNTELYQKNADSYQNAVRALLENELDESEVGNYFTIQFGPLLDTYDAEGNLVYDMETGEPMTTQGSDKYLPFSQFDRESLTFVEEWTWNINQGKLTKKILGIWINVRAENETIHNAFYIPLNQEIKEHKIKKKMSPTLTDVFYDCPVINEHRANYWREGLNAMLYSEVMNYCYFSGTAYMKDNSSFIPIDPEARNNVENPSYMEEYDASGNLILDPETGQPVLKEYFMKHDLQALEINCLESWYIDIPNAVFIKETESIGVYGYIVK